SPLTFSVRRSTFSAFRSHRRAPGRQLAARRAIRPVAQDVIGLHQLMNLTRAFVDDRALAVPEESAHGVLIGIPIGAMDLYRIACRTLRGDRGEPLCQPCLSRVPLPVVLQPAGAQPQQAGSLIVRLHLRDHFLHELVLADFDAEGLAIFRVADARIAARSNEAGGTGRDCEAALVEREHRDLEALARPANEILSGDLDVLHLEEPRIARENAPFLLQSSARKALERPLDDERTDAGGIAQLFLLEIAPRE